MKRLPIHKLKTSARELSLGGAKVFHLANWSTMSHPQRLRIIRQISMMRGRDPRIAQLAVKIIRESGAKPREYVKQAQALLAWIQNPKNFYYVNEPGERLQDPVYSIRVGYGDCFAEGTLLLRDDMRLVPVEDIKAGDRIWGKDRWSLVERQWSKGVLPIVQVELNNGSNFRVTEDHKVYVESCAGPKKGEKFDNGRTCAIDHGPDCLIGGNEAQCRHRFGVKEVRLKVRELKPGMRLIQPKKIHRSGDVVNSDREQSWLMGAYIAEGWSEPSRVAISGKDGHWKEATKHRAVKYAESRGWPTRWHARYLAVNSREAVTELASCGSGAANKMIPEGALLTGDLAALDEGLKLDASRNTHGKGWTFGTASQKLATQYRVLQRMLGRSTSYRKVTDHGGFGTNPIYRIGVRDQEQDRAERGLKVKALVPVPDPVPVYDITTDDHYVYLPEADVTVSNCDDSALVLGSMFESVGLPWKLVLSGQGPQGKTRYIEGDVVPSDVRWSHIYLMVGDRPFSPTNWYFAEPTVQGVPLGWDVVSGDHSYLPEMAKPAKGPAKIVTLPPAASRNPHAAPSGKFRSPAFEVAYSDALGNVYGSAQVEGYGNARVSTAVGASLAEQYSQQSSSVIDWSRIGAAVLTGVAVSVGTSLTLDWIKGQGIWQGKGHIFARAAQLLGKK